MDLHHTGFGRCDGFSRDESRRSIGLQCSRLFGYSTEADISADGQRLLVQDSAELEVVSKRATPFKEPRWRGVLFVSAQLSLLALIAMGPRGLGPELPASWVAAAIVGGLVLALVGGILALAGAVHLGPNLTPFPLPSNDATLIRSGAFRIVRHPIYCGLILMAFGWGLFVHGGLTLLYALALFVVLDGKSRYEERLLVAKFEEYRDYQRRVPRLIPFLY
jgi:protein-S-isoprenylcysteine O-methyltransferase Ste14